MVNPATNEMGSSARRRWLFSALAAVGGLTAGGLLAWRRYRPAEPAATAAEDFWALDFETPAGQMLPMAGFRGRPLLLNFWATWCPPCVEELPLLNAFYKENGADGWQVLGLALDKPGPVEAFLARSPLSFPVVLGGAQGLGLGKALGNLSGGLPFSVVFGADGTVKGRKIGKLNNDDLRRWRELK